MVGEAQSPSQAANPGLRPPKRKDADHKAPGAEPNRSPEDTANAFHVFTWLEDVQHFSGKSDPVIDIDALDKQMREVDVYLADQTGAADQKSYQDLPPVAQAASWAYIKGVVGSIRGGGNKYPAKAYYDERVDIINAAELVFTFFLPSDYQGPTAEKFWGAIRCLIEVSICPLRCGVGNRLTAKDAAGARGGHRHLRTVAKDQRDNG